MTPPLRRGKQDAYRADGHGIKGGGIRGMDRDDARFVVDALACRIAGDREGLDRLAASSLMRISSLATVVRRAAQDWAPAHIAADELMAICRRGGRLCDDPAPPLLQNFVDSLKKLAAEPARPVPRNRAERREAMAALPRAERRRPLLVGRPGLIH